jgi:hypothetical protein
MLVVGGRGFVGAGVVPPAIVAFAGGVVGAGVVPPAIVAFAGGVVGAGSPALASIGDCSAAKAAPTRAMVA